MVVLDNKIEPLLFGSKNKFYLPIILLDWFMQITSSLNHSIEKHSFPFLFLPPELRWKVYKFASPLLQANLAQALECNHRTILEAKILVIKAFNSPSLFQEIYLHKKRKHPFLDWYQRLSPNTYASSYTKKWLLQSAKINLFTRFSFYSNSLKSLRVEIPNLKIKDCAIFNQFSVLKSLALFRCHLLTNDWVRHLPKSLTSLVAPHSDLSDEDVEFLPRKLVIFYSRGAYLTEESIKNFPQNLTFLKLRGNILLEDNCVRFLPPQLKTLWLPMNEKFTNNAIESLPKSLTHLYLSSTTPLTKECRKHLPPQLDEMIPNFLKKKKKILNKK